jgi:aryl-alcohol dehydrogenase-like predicted oxidoreductase
MALIGTSERGRFRRPLGSTGISVSPIGLGTVKFGRNRGLKYAEDFDLPDLAHLAKLLGVAADQGVNLLDTAPAYGLAEERLGELLAGQRAHWVIASKAGEEFTGGQSQFDFSPKAIRSSVERTLRRLRTDWIDLVSIHSDGIDETAAKFGPALDMLQDLKRDGLIRAVGYSGKTVAGGLMALDSVDAVMVTFNAADAAHRTVIEAAQARGKGVLIKKALASGSLTDGPDAAAAAFRFIFAQPEISGGISSVLVGTLNPLHLKENVEAAARGIAGAGLQPIGPEAEQD